MLLLIKKHFKNDDGFKLQPRVGMCCPKKLIIDSLQKTVLI